MILNADSKRPQRLCGVVEDTHAAGRFGRMIVRLPTRLQR
jgi:hypothetical protein